MTLRLDPQDLIDDREVAKADQDRLAHDAIVQQLAALVRTVKTPTNIALYGPWGSGKSGIANLLRDQVDGKGGIRFVRFDAFKYVDVPLRRNFISALATGLKIDDAKFHDDLYSGQTKTSITFPTAAYLKILGTFAALLTGLAIIIAAVLALIALVQGGDFMPTFRSLTKTTVAAGLLPASLLAALMTLATKTFSVDRATARPESDEQFEKLFDELVSASKANRLVVFVDELDRCSPSEVVGTLDAVRTFLGVDKCIFIVAADQSVLEEALTHAARQETPRNETNPYYSTGSAYLDKVFQYQIAIPPLLTQSVSNFAATLVKERKGLWQQVRADYVLSVLIPTHVTSPRRVKHLLNTFALTYRLAEERHAADLLAVSPADVQGQIARLVCLNVEFPLFAQSLLVDPDLPDYVLALKDDSTYQLPAIADPRARELARAYALEGAAPAALISGTDNDQEEEASPDPSVAHNQQLINYLRRTRGIDGPVRDLLYMQSTGTVFGLNGDLARTLERAGADGDSDTLQERIHGLDDVSRAAALSLLLQQVRDGVGIVGPNTAKAMLDLIHEAPDLPAQHVVDSLAESVGAFEDQMPGDVLKADSSEAAWTLAALVEQEGSTGIARDLRRRVITRASATNDPAAHYIFNDAVLALDAARDETSAYIVEHLFDPDSPVDVTESIMARSDADTITVLSGIRQEFAAKANNAIEAHREWTKQQRDTAVTATSARTTATSEPTPEPPLPSHLLTQFALAATRRESPVQQAVITLLLDIDIAQARDAIEKVLAHTTPVDDTAIATRMLSSCQKRAISLWPHWLTKISPTAITGTHAPLLNQLLHKTWTTDADQHEVGAALNLLPPLTQQLAEARRPDLTDMAVKAVAAHVDSSEDAATRLRLLDRADLLASHGYVQANRIASAVAATLQDTLAERHAVVDADDPLYLYATRAVGTLALLTEEELREFGSVAAEATTCSWLDPLGQLTIATQLAKASKLRDVDDSTLPDMDSVIETIDAHKRLAAPAVADWITITQPGADDLHQLVQALRSANALTQALADVLRAVVVSWDNELLATWWGRQLPDSDTATPGDMVLHAIAWANTVAPSVSGQFLRERFEQATNNNQRQLVVTLWDKAQISDAPVTKSLIESITLALLRLNIKPKSNVGAADLALDSLANLVEEGLPHGVKGALGEHLAAATKDHDDLERRAVRLAPRLGYTVSKRGVFGRTKQIDYDK